MLKRFLIITVGIEAETISDQEGRVVAVVPRRRDAEYVCRWCFGRPMPGHDMCSRVTCISAVQAIESLDTMTWRGEDR